MGLRVLQLGHLRTKAPQIGGHLKKKISLVLVLCCSSAAAGGRGGILEGAGAGNGRGIDVVEMAEG